MRRKNSRLWARRTIAVALLAAGAAGCSSVSKEPSLSYIGKASLKYYQDEATDVSYPTGAEGDPSPILASDEPRQVGDRRRDEVWDLSLTEALHCALTNSKVIRSRVNRAGQFGSLGFRSNALTNPDRIPSIYDPAIQETGVLFGGRGVEAALADFDAQFTSSMVWGRNAAYQNNAFQSGFGGQFNNNQSAFVLTQETAQFQSGISKQFATGGSANVFHNWNYNGNNLPGTSQLFQSAYTGNTGVQFRQPLLAGSGVEFTRIAGPTNPNFGAITGVTQGVLIARINNDITVADFEISVRNLLKDVEDVYWNLYFAYRQFDAAVTARNSALRSWREAELRLKVGGVAGFRPADEAQARDRYFETRAQVESAQNEIYITEAELRRLMGLPPNDGRVIRPIEEPSTAKLIPDWQASLTDALMFRTELRRQKWNIKSLQLQLVAAENLTRPRLDFVSQYAVNGFGDKLISRGDDDAAGTVQGLDSAYGTLLQGDQTGWNLGVEMSVPIGFRQAKAQVRNIELRLAKAREVLNVQELDVSHEVADALQAVSFQYQNAETNFNRRAAAARRAELFEQELEAGTVTLDEVLRAQASLATAEVEYFRSLVQYNQALSYLHLVKGTLLERNSVHLEEGTWTPKAYEQALRKAWERSNAFANPMLDAHPGPFAIPDDSRQVVRTVDESVPPAPAGETSLPPAPAASPEPEPEADPTPATAEPAVEASPEVGPPSAPAASVSRARRPSSPFDEPMFELPYQVAAPKIDYASEFAAAGKPPMLNAVQPVAHEKSTAKSASVNPAPAKTEATQPTKPATPEKPAASKPSASKPAGSKDENPFAEVEATAPVAEEPAESTASEPVNPFAL
ncbi:MAG: TolC family protein [Planctomycetaceae bacterium]